MSVGKLGYAKMDLKTELANSTEVSWMETKTALDARRALSKVSMLARNLGWLVNSTKASWMGTKTENPLVRYLDHRLSCQSGSQMYGLPGT